MSTTRRVTISTPSEDWEELTELLEDIAGYTPDRPTVYAAVQAIAEGRAATLSIPTARVDEFVMHMREFRIDTQVAPT